MATYQNVTIEPGAKKDTLTLTIALDAELGESSTGKSVKVASTGGNVPVPGRPELRIGVNVFRPLSD